MTSLWTTYSPGSPPTGDVKHSKPDASQPANSSAVVSPVWNSNAAYPDPAGRTRDFPTASLELVEPDTKLVCMETPSVHERIGPNSFAPSVTSATGNGIPMETTDKTAPILISATSLSVRFRPSISSSSPYGASLSAQRTSTSERLDNAVTHAIGPSLPTHDRVDGPQRPSLPGVGDTTAQTAHFSERVATSPEPLPTLERHLFSSTPITNSSATVPIPTAMDRPPSPLSISTNQILTTDVNATASNGTYQPTPPNVTLSPNLNRERNYQERRVPKRSVTDGTSVSGGSIVKSQYTDMVFEEVPRMYSLLSFLFTWILLAGFIVLPGTFNTLEGIANDSTRVKKVLHTIQHLPLYVPSLPT